MFLFFASLSPTASKFQSIPITSDTSTLSLPHFLLASSLSLPLGRPFHSGKEGRKRSDSGKTFLAPAPFLPAGTDRTEPKGGREGTRTDGRREGGSPKKPPDGGTESVACIRPPHFPSGGPAKSFLIEASCRKLQPACWTNLSEFESFYFVNPALRRRISENGATFS